MQFSCWWFFVNFTVLLFKSYQRCPSDRAIRTGIGGLWICRNHGIVVLPLVQSHGILSLEPLELRLPVNAADGLRRQSNWQFTVAVGTTLELTEMAATRLLNKEPNEISQLATDAIAGVLSRTTELPLTTAKLGDAVEESLRTFLSNFGLELLSYGPTDE